MTAGSGSALITQWEGASWRAEAAAWIEDRLRAAGLTATGPIVPELIRPWSVHLTVPTSDGRMWFKESCPPARFEAGLMECLARLAPGRVLEPVAVDPGRGWLLSPDGGRTLDQTDLTSEEYGRVLAEFAELQRLLAGHRDDLVAAGLPELPAIRVADHFEDQLRELERLPGDHPSRIGPEVIAAAVQDRPLIMTAARQLAEGSVPDSLQHNDVQPANTFESVSGGVRFFDFGDALWSHPFCVLDVAVHRIAQRWHCDRDDPRIRQVIDCYLEVWTGSAPMPELRALVEPALTIARLQRYNSWHRLIPYVPDAELRRHAGYPEALAGAERAS